MHKKALGISVCHRNLVNCNNKYLQPIITRYLANYWKPMESDKVNHIFKPESKFENVVTLNCKKLTGILQFSWVSCVF